MDKTQKEVHDLIKNLPVVQMDSDRNFIPNVERDSQGRIAKAYGRIPITRERGTPPSQKMRNIIKELGEDGDDAGHIIPCCLNGSGRHPDNLFPQNAKVNRWSGYGEFLLQQAMHQEKMEIGFYFEFFYADDNDLTHNQRPTKIRQQISLFKDDRYDAFKILVKNPSNEETKNLSASFKHGYFRELACMMTDADLSRLDGASNFNALQLMINSK